jgi:hypothetical protein
VASCWRLEDGKAVTIEGEEESGGGRKLTCVKLRRVFFPKTDGSDLMKSASFDRFFTRFDQFLSNPRDSSWSKFF